MNEAQVKQNVQALQKRRESLVTLKGKERSNALLKSGSGATGDIGDTDRGTDLARQTVALSLTKMESSEIANIDAAIERAHQGRYGLCEVCGRPIAAERLKSIPEASSCMSCEASARM